MSICKTICTICLSAFTAMPLLVAAQADNGKAKADYNTVITQRANKIVVALDIKDSAKFYRVQNIIADQYRQLSAVHDSSNAAVKAAKTAAADKDAVAAAVTTIENSRNAQLDKFHQQYISNLAKEISAEQIVKVKDGMTYNILPVTYKAYQDMLPDLTADQKKQIYAWLEEAREHAIDAESSDKKHAWFGKYKGRINNYMSAQGVDMKKAGEEWQARIKAAKGKQ